MTKGPIILKIAAGAGAIILLAAILWLAVKNFGGGTLKVAENESAKTDAIKEEPAGKIAAEEDNKISQDSKFEAVLAQLDTSDKIAAYLKSNFSITDNESDSALSPADFFNNKSGGPQDAAVFAASVLKRHGFESFVLRYKGEINGQPFSHTVAVFRDTDVPKYLTADSSGINLTAHGWSFEDLLKKEEERTKASISGYAVFAPDTLNLKPASWEKRK